MRRSGVLQTTAISAHPCFAGKTASPCLLALLLVLQSKGEGTCQARASLRVFLFLYLTQQGAVISPEIQRLLSLAEGLACSWLRQPHCK